MGYPSLRLVIVPHPLGGISPEQALDKVPDAVEQAISHFDSE